MSEKDMRKETEPSLKSRLTKLGWTVFNEDDAKILSQLIALRNPITTGYFYPPREFTNDWETMNPRLKQFMEEDQVTRFYPNTLPNKDHPYSSYVCNP
jgi:hypothetical protein